MSEDVCTCKVRVLDSDDIAFVANSLSRNYAANALGPESYLTRRDRSLIVRRRLDEGMRLGHHLVDVAVDPEDSTLILGWIWYAHPHFLHYIYIREPFRGEGLALQLLSPLATQSKIFCSHWTRDFERFASHNSTLYRRL